MPRFPVYVDLLPKAAQEVIGKMHPHTLPAYHVLESEGLRYQGYVDILMQVQPLKPILMSCVQLKKANFNCQNY